MNETDKRNHLPDNIQDELEKIRKKTIGQNLNIDYA